jgi:epoxyqueuosine reductase
MLSILKTRVKELGFIHIGFVRPDQPPFFDAFNSWIFSQKHGGMKWMERHVELRRDPAQLLEGCQTIISLAYPYSSIIPITPEGLRLSRYSHLPHDDYHYRLHKLGKKIISMIQEYYPDSRSRFCVDSAPILERSLAYAAGLGFFGKNNSLIMPGYGSYFYLSEILTTADLNFSPAVSLESQCADCRLCLDACPTGALERPYTLNASRCLSYLTIEDKKEIEEKVAAEMGNCFFGCDRCQEVCPHNKKFPAQRKILLPSKDEFLFMKKEEFKARYGRTVLGRTGLTKIQSNLRVITKGRSLSRN